MVWCEIRRDDKVRWATKILKQMSDKTEIIMFLGNGDGGVRQTFCTEFIPFFRTFLRLVDIKWFYRATWIFARILFVLLLIVQIFLRGEVLCARCFFLSFSDDFFIFLSILISFFLSTFFYVLPNVPSVFDNFDWRHFLAHLRFLCNQKYPPPQLLAKWKPVHESCAGKTGVSEGKTIKSAWNR